MVDRSLKTVAIVASPGCSLLELVGAHYLWAVASMMSTIDAAVVAATKDFVPVTVPLPVRAQKTFAEVPNPDVLIVVGGGDMRLEPDPAVIDYVRSAGSRASIVASTSSGSLVLAEAGLLEGVRAATHPSLVGDLIELGVSPVEGRWAEDGRFFTGSGAAAAIDLSLLLIERMRGTRLARRVQVGAEWDPSPPFRLDADQASTPERESDVSGTREIALLIYDDLTVLDLVGPLEVLSMLARHRPEFRVTVVTERPGEVKSDSGLVFQVDGGFDAVERPEVLVVPGGGTGTLRAMANPAIRAFVKETARDTSVTASVCTGALILASVGLLEGREATTHWAYRSYLEPFGSRYVQRRWVESDGMINAAGVSAGIDMAIRLVARLTDDNTALGVQRALHYDPRSPLGPIRYDRLPLTMRVMRALTRLGRRKAIAQPKRMLASGI
jgi:transcriptional regulator GlxA family with amidase domain